MSYQPIELIAESREEFEDRPNFPRENPRRRSKRVDEYFGLRVKIALVRDPNYNPKEKFEITSPEAVFLLLKNLRDEAVETFQVLIVNTRHRVLGVYEAARGGVAEVSILPVDILRAVLAAGASRYIVAHNHPSGDPEPSQSDEELTNRLQAAGKLLGMTLLDHIVIGMDSYVSFNERGLL